MTTFLKRHVTAKSLDYIETAQRHELAKCLHGHEPKITILFGAGNLGVWTSRKMTANLIVNQGPWAEGWLFADNNSISENCGGMMSAQYAIDHYKDTALFVVTIFNGDEVREQLRKAGCRYVVSAWTYYRSNPTQFMPFICVDRPVALFEDDAKIEAAYNLLADDESREEFLNVLRFHTQTRYVSNPSYHSQGEIYFPEALIKPIAGEVFVDCGAYDGDTLKDFLIRYGYNFRRYIAFEPDKANFKALSKYALTLPDGQDDLVEIHNLATSNDYGMVQFSTGDVASALSSSGDTQVEAVPLDDFLNGVTPTYIKMDIEGAESLAIEGARGIIANAAPVLAIVLYHKIRDLWEIPLQVAAIQPGYKFYIRRYALDCFETVMYAVPAGRVA
jgi:FkbM family methyltransferase